jgi:hypothetical protein
MISSAPGQTAVARVPVNVVPSSTELLLQAGSAVQYEVLACLFRIQSFWTSSAAEQKDLGGGCVWSTCCGPGTCLMVLARVSKSGILSDGPGNVLDSPGACQTVLPRVGGSWHGSDGPGTCQMVLVCFKKCGHISDNPGMGSMVLEHLR